MDSQEPEDANVDNHSLQTDRLTIMISNCNGSQHHYIKALKRATTEGGIVLRVSSTHFLYVNKMCM